MSGRVEEAVSTLNKHFPSVLGENVSTTAPKDTGNDAKTVDPDSNKPVMNNLEYVSSTSTEPAHLMLNLRILAFSEACRTVPLGFLPGHDSSEDRKSTKSPMDTELLVMKAQKLYALMNMLPDPADRITYSKELKNVSGLLAYPVPEESSISKYLTMERREAVADQINRAILSKPTFFIPLPV